MSTFNLTSTDQTTSSVQLKEAVISESLGEWLDNSIHYLILFFGSLGVVTNTINVRVFVRQGLWSDSNTIGLFSLAIADFVGCFVELPLVFCRLIRYSVSITTFFSCRTWTRLLFEIPHIIMSRVTCWITVYIAVERCLCVIIPFKVKLLLVPKTTLIVMALIYLTIIGAHSPIFVYTRIIWISSGNESFAIFEDSTTLKLLVNYIGLIFNTILSTAAFFITVVATGLLLYKLLASRNFRKTATSKSKFKGTKKRKEGDDSKQEESSKGKKDFEVLKTVTMVTVLFLICLSMSHIPGLATLLLPGVTPTGFNKGLFHLLYYYKILFDLINSSLNYFFYIRFSSRYKKAFSEIFKKH